MVSKEPIFILVINRQIWPPNLQIKLSLLLKKSLNFNCICLIIFNTILNKNDLTRLIDRIEIRDRFEIWDMVILTIENDWNILDLFRIFNQNSASTSTKKVMRAKKNCFLTSKILFLEKACGEKRRKCFVDMYKCEAKQNTKYLEI